MSATNIIIRKRITKLFLIVGAVLFLLVGRLAWIQFVQGEWLRQQAIENRMDDVPVPAKRGTIYDRNGKELAVSVSGDSVMAFPADVKKGDPEKTARELAAILNMDYKEVYDKITQKKISVWVKRKVEINKSKLIREKNLKGIEVYEESQRSYPNGKLAAHLLGFVGIDNTGLNGIEMSMNKELSGIPGRIIAEKDAAGRQIPQAMHKYIEPVPGNSLVLTLDETIQYFAERELDKVMEKNKPKGASIIVMDPQTGGILAMANRPDFDPNNYSEYKPETWRNNAIWLNYEPGSTFKIITSSAGLEEGVVRPEDRFYDPGYVMVADRRIKCWKPEGHGAQSFVEVVQNSCNPGFIKVGLDLGKERFYKYIKAFGFGQRTGIPLAGESKGIVIPEKNAKPINVATISIGQSISVTPIQLITAVSAVANNGVLLKPQLVKEIHTPGGEVKKIEPVVVKEVLSKSAAKQVAGLLEKVVSEEGTGIDAIVEGYRMAGKTGTAQKAEAGRYAQGKYVASFAGFGPVDNPRIAVLVVIDEPQGAYYGGQIAAPVFRELARDILRYLNVPPQVSPEKVKEDPLKQEVMVPDVINTSLDEAQQILRESGLQARVEGSGGWIVNQQPKAGGRVKVNTQVVLYAGPATKDIPDGQEVTMPDVTGYTMREAGRLLGRLGIKMDPQGTGVAVSQKVAPGTKVKSGSAVTVIFEPPVTEGNPSVPEAAP